MTDIFPAADQSATTLIEELTALGLVDGRDFKLHFSWDAKPLIQASDEAYEKWVASRPKVSEDVDKPDAEKESKPDSSESGAQDARRGNTKRR
jgi:hypothetical protein